MSYSRPLIRSLRGIVPSTISGFFWAWMDIKCRYRRSTLGPFWETANMSVMIAGMATVSSALFNVPVGSILPYLALGIVVWTVIANSINEGANCFVSHSNMLKNTNFSIGLYVGRTTLRIYINAAHHLIIFVLAIVFFDINMNAATLLFIPGVCLLFLNSLWVVPTLGFVCSRFRDFEMVAKNLTQLLFFVTPIFWDANVISSNKRIIIDLNPFYYFIEIVRAPLLGVVPPIKVYVVVLGITLFGFFLLAITYKKMREKLVFYC